MCAFYISPITWGTRAHTSYLSREPGVYPCKFCLAGVNFYRFNAKNWHFRQILREKVAFFTDLTRKIGVFGVNFIIQKFCPCKKNYKYEVWYRWCLYLPFVLRSSLFQRGDGYSNVLTVFGNQNEVLSRQMIKCSNSGGACHVNPRIRNTKQSSHVAGSQL